RAAAKRGRRAVSVSRGGHQRDGHIRARGAKGEIVPFPLAAALYSAQTLGILLWIGLALLTVALVVLMRTRWGQTKPLSKCVALSIFAHILLGGYAYGTRLVFDVPQGGGGERVVKVKVLDAGRESQAASAVPRNDD